MSELLKHCVVVMLNSKCYTQLLAMLILQRGSDPPD